MQDCLGTAADVSTLHSRIRKILKEPIKGFNSINNNKKLEQVIEQYSLKDKPGTDLTDRLWLLFIGMKNMFLLLSHFISNINYYVKFNIIRVLSIFKIKNTSFD